ncbi:MAG: hypothetical protein ABGX23_04540 [Nautiliaceae bacterium]
MTPLPLKDVKSIEIIPTWSLILAIVIVLVAIIILKVRKKETIKFNFKNSKESAYKFSIIAPKYINEKNQTLFQIIQEEIKIYKYKPNVPPMKKEDIEMIKEFFKYSKTKIKEV